MSNRYYKYAAIYSALKTYVSMNVLASAICLAADDNYKALTIQSTKSNKMKFRMSRDCQVDIKKAIRKALKNIIDSSVGASISTYIEDKYEFELTDDLIDSDFVNQIFEIEMNNKTVEVTINE